MKVLSTGQVPIAGLHPYPGNARTHDLPVIVRSLQRNGQYRAIVVQKKGMRILAGHGTVQAAGELEWTRVLAHLVECTPAEAKRIVLVDNRANDLAGYDDGALAQLLGSLGPGALDGTGYDDQALKQLLADVANTSPERDTPAAAPPKRPATRTGDIYTLGVHRLLCGDCQQLPEVQRLLGGGLADMVLTDPPYGVEYSDGAIAGDTIAGLPELLHTALANARAASSPGASAYVFHADTNGGIFRAALAAAGWELKQVLVWVKQQLVLGRQDYHWKHEPILYAWNPGAAHRWYGDRSQTTVIDDDVDIARLKRPALLQLLRELRGQQATTVLREDRPHTSELHPTMKPVALCARLLANSSSTEDLVLDPFAGSGSTMLAAENLGRRCYAIEIDRGYCDVIVQRWQEHTGQKATRERV